jgi:DNA repair exonuclease SbcCD ATPase subunit
MRPHSISDAAIIAAVRELQAQSGRVTGVAVRALLERRYGVRGGVARIYRLLEDHRRRAVPSQPAPGAHPTTVSDESRDAAIRRADLAEERERIHQERWARETDTLRMRAADAERLRAEAALYRQRLEELTRALATAQTRIVTLEQRTESTNPVAPP